MTDRTVEERTEVGTGLEKDHLPETLAIIEIEVQAKVGPDQD